MASRHGKKNGYSSQPQYHFFRIVLEETIREGKLGIPIKFIREYGKQLSSTIQLQVPNGEIWHVELEKRGDNVWLQKGWPQFAQHHSLEFGHFLVFRYAGSCRFHVLIFDKTTTEIDYPHPSTEDDDISIELCDGCRKKNKMKSDLPCPRPSKKMRIDSPNQTGTSLKSEVLRSRISPDHDHLKYSTTIKLGNPGLVEKSHCSATKLDGCRKSTEKLHLPCAHSSTRKKMRNEYLSGKNFNVGGTSDRNGVATEVLSCGQQHLTATERAHVLQIASAFKSNGNPAFMTVMKPTFIHPKYQMVIPSSIAREYFNTNNGKLTLFDSNGKTWHSEYYCSVKKEKSNAYFRGGWRAFAEDNNLNLGDVCVFELINKYPQILMKVEIFHLRSVENASKALACRPPGTNVKKEASFSQNIEFASEVTKKNSSFVVVMKEYMKYFVVVPRSFVEETGLAKKHNTIIKDPRGEIWPLNVVFCQKSQVRLCGGWLKFLQKNQVVVGDTLLFEHIPNTDNLIHVKIISKA